MPTIPTPTTSTPTPIHYQSLIRTLANAKSIPLIQISTSLGYTKERISRYLSDPSKPSHSSMRLSTFTRILTTLNSTLYIRDPLTQEEYPLSSLSSPTSPTLSIYVLLKVFMRERNITAVKISQILHKGVSSISNLLNKGSSDITMTVLQNFLSILQYDLIVKDMDSPGTEYILIPPTIPPTIPSTTSTTPGDTDET